MYLAVHPCKSIHKTPLSSFGSYKPNSFKCESEVRNEYACSSTYFVRVTTPDSVDIRNQILMLNGLPFASANISLSSLNQAAPPKSIK